MLRCRWPIFDGRFVRCYPFEQVEACMSTRNRVEDMPESEIHDRIGRKALRVGMTYL